ncbi:MAG: aminoacyl-tRNA hydrolase [Gammaproteobacteria bacterium]|nr:aminoacyl-tRNA hydrolase [Gammaproteobacteria bacterium]MDE0365284.1 aminoacyl-tRNA hydrolase [Gammaproteobacteria bacterium]
MAIRLIAGLGNPGARYEATRHNAGRRFVRYLARRFGIELTGSTKFKASAGRGNVGEADLRLLLPSTYMNRSGEAVGVFARYYRIDPEEILVAHDEVAFPPGMLRLKDGGGTNGHNGIESVIAGLGSRDFARLRIGVGHPGDKDRMLGYLTTSAMPESEWNRVDAACRLEDELLEVLLRGDLQAAMNRLHKPEANEP